MTRPDTLESGARLGRYEITGLLGVGGMGEVYRAVDERLGRQVAIKVLPKKLAEDEDALARFRRESKAVAALSHPNIRAIYDIDTDGQTSFAVMELLEGQTIDEQLTGEPMPWQRAVSVAVDIAEGLAAAHAKGIIHRDIKPQNIFLTETGKAKILDFGLARISAPGTDSDEAVTATMMFATQAGTIMGTVQYMSPEQVRGQAADARSDIFSFGCVLHEMVTRQRPFAKDSPPETMTAILHETPPKATDHGVTIPLELQRIIDHCLEKNPLQRFQSARDLPFALRGLSSGSHSALPPEEIRTPRSGTAVRVPEAPNERSVAVLPFVNMSSDEENEFFSDGLAEELINALSKIEGLKVTSRTSAFAFKSKTQDIREIGEQLNVYTVLEGSVRKSGNRLRIRAQLVNVADGYHLWSETFDRQMEDIFAVQDEIAENIAKALRVVLTDQAKRALTKVPTDNIEAYEYYLRGRQSYYQMNRRGLERARKLFGRAVELDAGYAAAFAGIADCCAILYMWFGAAEIHKKEAQDASREAVELDHELAEAHVSRGNALVLDAKFERAEKEFLEAIRLGPENFEAQYFYGRACFGQGLFEQAAALFESASAIRPEDYQSPNLLANAYEGLGRVEDAKKSYRHSFEAAEKHLELFPEDGRALYFGAMALIELGENAKGLEWVERAIKAEPEEPVVLYNVGCVYSKLGNFDRAFSCLDDAVTFGIGQKEWFTFDPDLDPLREDPRFDKLLERI